MNEVPYKGASGMARMFEQTGQNSKRFTVSTNDPEVEDHPSPKLVRLVTHTVHVT